MIGELRRQALRYGVPAGVIIAIAAIAVVAPPAWAQSVSSGTIHGTVKDDTGGALPGVTVTVASPALQVKQMIDTTGAAGDYRFVDLPPGTYRVTFDLPGFRRFVREDLRLTVGFVARVDAVMQVGGLEESITVSGESPVVDMTSTSASVAFSREILDAVPQGRDLQNVYAMTPGVTQAEPDVGGSTMAERQTISSYGVAAQPKLQVEGMNITMGADTNSAIYFMSDSLEEVQIKTSGADAEVSVPGISVVAVLKSGGNVFHGTYGAAYQTSELQSNNLDDALRAQGLSATRPLKSFHDVAADLGGPIVRDKLWFYGAYSRQKKTEGLVGFAAGPGPDGRYLTGDEPEAHFEPSLAQFTAKFSYQLSKSNRLVYAYQRGNKRQPQNGAGRFRPLEATRDYYNPTAIQKGEFQSTLTEATLLNLIAGYSGYRTDYDAARSFARPDAPPRQDLETGLATGSHDAHQGKTRDRYQLEGSISFYPERPFAGRHELKTGAMAYLDRASDGWFDNLACNCVLQTDRIGGVSGTPVRIVMRNTPVTPLDNADTFAVYVKDTWRLTDRLTVNLGARWERQTSYLPAQSAPPARDFPTVFPGGSFPRLDVGEWSRIVPRVGVAWALDQKSVVKGSFGAYNYMFGDTFGDRYNRNATGTATFLWHDLNGDKLYQPGEVNLNLNGPDFVSITGASNARINPGLREPKTLEATATFERELTTDVGFRAMYVGRRLVDYFSGAGPNILRPYSVYDIPITRRDPGPDGVLNTADDGGRVTFFDYRPAYRGAAFVATQVTNSPNDDSFHAMEFALTKRASARWMAQASYFLVKNHRWLTQTINSPNDEFFPIDDTWSWGATVTGSYRLPGDVSISGFFQGRNGVKGQRTYIFRAVDPDGGPRIAQLNNVTLRLEPYGSQHLAAINILNLRASKEIALGGSRRLGVEFDVFNALNSNAPLSATFASGPTFGYVTDVMAARIARIGARFRF
ncbi:MAG: TonB-dependent receptor [Acidobacteria bacterium]|nr:TonB-dependent receptor [Acidobacteriota bacterium]